MSRRWPKLAFLHKIETQSGVDSAPAAANAIVAKNITFTPMQAEEQSRDLLLPFMGNQGMLLTGEHGRLEFDVEIAGSGTAGTAPRYGSLLRVCGMAETIVAGTSITYTIVEAGTETSTIHFNSDGVRHVFLGARANVAMNFVPKQIPTFRFTLVGMLGQVTDAALPTVTQEGWIIPVQVNKANTVLTLHGWTAIAESLALDLGNVLTPRHLIGVEDVLITDRQATGTAVVEAKSLATVNWFQKAQNRERGALFVAHGTTEGNIVEVAAPAVEIGAPSQGQTNNIVNYSLALALCPDEGMDELSITVR